MWSHSVVNYRYTFIAKQQPGHQTCDHRQWTEFGIQKSLENLHTKTIICCSLTINWHSLVLKAVLWNTEVEWRLPTFKSYSNCMAISLALTFVSSPTGFTPSRSWTTSNSHSLEKRHQLEILLKAHHTNLFLSSR